MELIYGWVKNIVCFDIFMAIILYLLPRESYRKYVRFFSGMLLIILAANPVLSLLGKEEMLLQKISQAGFFQELDNVKLDTRHLEQAQKKAYVKEYERAVEMDASRIAEGKQMEVLWADVQLSEEYQVESICMEVALMEEDGSSMEKASFGEGSREYPNVYGLKQELMEFYRLGEEQITIAVRDR